MNDEQLQCEFCDIDGMGNHAGRCPVFLENIVDKQRELIKVLKSHIHIVHLSPSELKLILELEDEIKKAEYDGKVEITDRDRIEAIDKCSANLALIRSATREHEGSMISTGWVIGEARNALDVIIQNFKAGTYDRNRSSK